MVTTSPGIYNPNNTLFYGPNGNAFAIQTQKGHKAGLVVGPNQIGIAAQNGNNGNTAGIFFNGNNGMVTSGSLINGVATTNRWNAFA